MKRLLPFLLLGLLLLPPRASAQTSSIKWTVVPGYNGTFKAGAWMPVTITIANDGADVQGRLEWRWQSSGTRFAQTVDLPRGARKRIVLPVVADNIGDTASLSLYNGAAILAREERVRFNAIDQASLLVGVISDDSGALAEVGGISAGPGPATTLVRLSQMELPERSELLQSLDVLFVHNVDTSSWRDAQRKAVTAWVAAGGQLVVSGDRITTAAGLAPLLPARVQAAQRSVKLQELAARTGWQPRDTDASVAAFQLQPTADAEVLASTVEGAPLLLRRSYGAGQVLQAAFDLQALQTYGDPVPLWNRLLARPAGVVNWVSLQANEQFMLQQAFAIPALRLPSLWSLLGFLGLYLGLVGPVNYIVLRRLDRREWAYLTIPLTVALFTAGAYGIGAAGRGGAATATALSIVTTAPGSATGQALSYLGIYSPTRRSYRVAFEPEALVEGGLSIFGPGRSTLELLRTESAVEIPRLFVDVGAVRLLNIQQPAPAPEVRASLRQDSAGWSLVVENRGTQPLEDVAIVSGQSVQKLPDLQPGQQQEVRLAPVAAGDPINFRNDGVIKRDAVMQALFNAIGMGGGVVQAPMKAPGAPDAPLPATQAVTLAAWSSQSNLKLALDGSAIPMQGATLYLWTLGKRQP